MSIRGKTILIVEDNHPIREPLAIFFTQEGAKVLEASHGSEALFLIERDRPDLMILDLRLPDISGIDVLLAARRKHPALLTIVTTAETSEDTARICRVCGVLEYITKPIDFGYLRRLVEKHLGSEPEEPGPATTT